MLLPHSLYLLDRVLKLVGILSLKLGPPDVGLSLREGDGVLIWIHIKSWWRFRLLWRGDFYYFRVFHMFSDLRLRDPVVLIIFRCLLMRVRISVALDVILHHWGRH